MPPNPLPSLVTRATHRSPLPSKPLPPLQPSRRLFQTLRDPPALRDLRRSLLQANRTIGLVPTMGALHRGHLALIRAAARENTDVIVSIYINPTQFGQNEDLASYPQTWETDMAALRALDRDELAAAAPHAGGRIAAVFAPPTAVMYPTHPPSSVPGPDAKGTFVTTQPLQTLLEGRSRPVFFRGVATVCAKLFNLVQPDRVYFGQKDVQQTVVIRKMVRDLHFGGGGMEVRVCGTEREADGLALSSRNVYLGERRRGVGVVLNRALRAAEARWKMGVRGREEVLGEAWAVVEAVLRRQEGLGEEERVRFEVDYLSLADPENLEEVDVVDEGKGAVLSGAIKMLPLEKVSEGEKLGLGDDKVPVRLIDNLILEP
ncbi:hypothetical protein MBLNU230_g2967t1 [Neophaeotheca triangularis]